MINIKFEISLGNVSFILLFCAMIFYWVKTSFSLFSRINFVGFSLTIFANLSLFILLILRWINYSHFPLSNMYESLLFLAWSLTLLQIILEKISNNTFLGAIVSPLALFTTSFASFSLPKEMQKASVLVPALQSNWLMMHVTVMMLSYAALLGGSVLAIAFLILTFGKKIELTGNSLGFIPTSSLTNSEDTFVNFEVTNPGVQYQDPNTESFLTQSYYRDFSKCTEDFPNKQSLLRESFVTSGNLDSSVAWDSGLPGLVLSAFANFNEVEQPKGQGEQATQTKKSFDSKLAKSLDNLSYRTLGIGFPLLTIGIISGAVWANEAWGSYWSWDPKETWALITWVVFAIYFHTRITKGWEGKKPAIIATSGFFIVWICYLGVNLLGKGLHSYGWIHFNL
jgi:cytochrome c-type biogenesis protein CcsB